jgi:hypothetical protein
VIYRTVKSIRARPAEWMFAVGLVAAMLPTFWFITGMLARAAIFSSAATADPPRNPRAWEELWLRMFAATTGPRSAYIFYASLGASPVMVCVAAFLVTRRYWRIRQRSERPTLEFWIVAALTVIALFWIAVVYAFLFWPAPWQYFRVGLQ